MESLEAGGSKKCSGTQIDFGLCYLRAATSWVCEVFMRRDAILGVPELKKNLLTYPELA